MSATEEPAPGWDAITARAEVFYRGEPVHRAMTPGVAFGSPLQGLSAYRGAHWWFFVTYGLSELFAKESENSDVSGWGYELTMRTPLSDTPPDWAFGVLASIADLTQSREMIFGQGHRLQTGHPLGGLPTRLTGIAFTIDPELGSISTANGKIDFLLVVGVTTDEIDGMKALSTAAVLADLETSTSLVTDPHRAPTV